METTLTGPLMAYKVFNPDWTCLRFQYEVGKEYECDRVEICKVGFHACLKANDCFNYYSFDSKNKVALVEMDGQIVSHGEDSKVASTKIKIIKELNWHEVLNLVNVGKNNTGRGNSGDRNSGNRNSGDRNSGNRNSGDRNSGHWNSGDRNSGDRNSGDRNSGHWNSGDRNSGDRNSGYGNSGDGNSGDGNSGYGNSGDGNSGIFNTNEPLLRAFNKETNIRMSELLNSGGFPDFSEMKLCEWISEEKMTDKEKVDNPKFYVTQGYLKKRTYKEAWAIWKEKCTPGNWARVLALPNFDAEIFEQITGIKVTQ